MSTKNIKGILVDANSIPLRNATIRFLSVSTDSTLNTIFTDYPTDANGSYDFLVNFGIYTVQIKRAEEIQYRTVCANVYVYESTLQTLEQVIAAQAHVVVSPPDVVVELQQLLAETQAAAAQAEAAALAAEGALIDLGSVDLSSGIYPAPITNPDTTFRSCLWKVTVAGSVSGVVFNVGDALVYSEDLASYYKIDNTDLVTSVAGVVGNVTLAQIGLDRVNNTNDLEKPLSTSTVQALANKSDLGHVHSVASNSANGFMSASDKAKLDTMDAGPAYVHPTSPITPGSYTKLDINSLGHATGGTNPSTLAGLGITDAFTKNELARVLSETPYIGLSDLVSVKDYGAIGDGTLHTLQEWVTSGLFASLAAIQLVYPKATSLTQSIDYLAIQTALDTGRGVNIPKGEYVVTEEIEQVTPGQHVYFENSGGYGYGEDIGLNWIPNTRIVLKGTFVKRVRTRRLYRFSAGDPQDAALSVGWNIQAESVFLHNPCIWLSCDYSNYSPTNFGDDCDIGIFSGCRVGVQLLNPQVIGYFRKSGIHFDATHATSLPRHLNKAGIPYPLGVNVSGGDGCHVSNPYVRGARRALVILGALPKVGETTYSTAYYDEQLGATVQDTRGTFGFSDFMVDGGGRLYGPDHHSNRRLWDPVLHNGVLDQVSLEPAPDDAPCSMYIDGMAGNSSQGMWGMRFIGVRFATFEAFRIRLGRTARIHTIGCHIEGRNGGRFSTTGVAIDSNNYITTSYGDVSGTSATSRVIIDGSVRPNSGDLYPHYYGSSISSRIDYGTIYAPSYQPGKESDNFDSRVADIDKLYIQRFGTVSGTTLSSNGYTFKGGIYSLGATIATEVGPLILKGATSVRLEDSNSYHILDASKGSTVLSSDSTQISSTVNELDLRSGSSSLLRFRTGSVTRATLSASAFTCNVPFVGTFIGSTDSAAKLQYSRAINASGDGSWSVTFDGSSDVTGVFTLANTGVTAGTYTKVQVDTKGRVLAGSGLVAADIPEISWNSIVYNKPTTLAGYGILNALATSGGTMTGALSLGASYLTATTELDLRAATGSLVRFRLGTTTLGTYSTSGFSSTVPFVGNLTGNATSADKLSTPRNLTIGSSVKSFDGSANVSWSLADIGALPLTGGMLSGPITLSSTYIGSLDEIDLRAAIGSLVRFRLGTTTLGTYSASGFISTVPFVGSLTGNASSADKLSTARTLTIGSTGKPFDGTSNVSLSLAEIGALPLAGGTLTGPLSLGDSYLTATTELDLRAATGSLVRFRVGTTTLGTYSASGFSSTVPFIGSLTGNASTATKWATPRALSFTGDATGSMTVDGSAAASAALTLAASGVAAGTYTKLTVDAKGRATAGTTLAAADIPALDWSKITTGKPTTLAGYGITDAQAALGFLPVQQGTGTNQTANTVKIGWSAASKLYLQVDANNFADIWPISITGNADTATKISSAKSITIGLTAKSVDLSAAVSWSLAEIGALPLTGGTLSGALSTSSYISSTADLDLRAASGSLIRFRQGSSTLGTFSTSAATFTVSTSVNASTDNTVSSGTASLRWSTVYAATGTINTSDERLKVFTSVEEAERLAALAIKPTIRKFKFLDAIEEKGEDNARWHFGVGAQTVGNIMLEHGLNPDDYAFYCYDEWPEQPEVLDEEGNVIIAYKEAGNRFSIRYDELAMFLISAL